MLAGESGAVVSNAFWRIFFGLLASDVAARGAVVQLPSDVVRIGVRGGGGVGAAAVEEIAQKHHGVGRPLQPGLLQELEVAVHVHVGEVLGGVQQWAPRHVRVGREIGQSTTRREATGVRAAGWTASCRQWFLFSFQTQNTIFSHF